MRNERSKNKMAPFILATLMILGIFVYWKGSITFPTYMDGKVIWLEWVFRDNLHGNIIGNPDFEPSFDHTDEDQFRQQLLSTRDALGYTFKIGEATESDPNYYSFDLAIENAMTLHYSEGFIKINMENYESNKTLFEEFLRTVFITLTPDEHPDELKDVNIQEFEEYNTFFYSSSISYRFYHDDEFVVEIEDMKMGH